MQSQVLSPALPSVKTIKDEGNSSGSEQSAWHADCGTYFVSCLLEEYSDKLRCILAMHLGEKRPMTQRRVSPSSWLFQGSLYIAILIECKSDLFLEQKRGYPVTSPDRISLQARENQGLSN